MRRRVLGALASLALASFLLVAGCGDAPSLEEAAALYCETAAACSASYGYTDFSVENCTTAISATRDHITNRRCLFGVAEYYECLAAAHCDASWDGTCPSPGYECGSSYYPAGYYPGDYWRGY